MLSINVSLVPSLQFLLKGFWTKQHGNCRATSKFITSTFNYLKRSFFFFTHKEIENLLSKLYHR